MVYDRTANPQNENGVDILTIRNVKNGEEFIHFYQHYQQNKSTHLFHDILEYE